MISIRRNSHLMNGEYVEVLEVWKRENEDKEATMILSIPLDHKEFVEAEIGASGDHTVNSNTPVLDVMTPDGRDKVANKMLDDLIKYHQLSVNAISQASQDKYHEKAHRLRVEILELMGVDYVPEDERVSSVPTPYAVICPTHGQVFLTHDEYINQMCKPDSLWKCPIDGMVCSFDDKNYEHALGHPLED
jgi:hypothetical protein